MTYRKTVYVTDYPGYEGPDSGCETASRFLGYRSLCLRCPFSTCVYRSLWLTRKRIMLECFDKGKTLQDVAYIFGVQLWAVRSVLKEKEQCLTRA